jgi:hypothetical protein
MHYVRLRAAIPAGSSPPELLSSDAVFPSSPRGNFVEQTPFRDAETLQDVVESTKAGISNLSYPVTYGSAGIAGLRAFFLTRRY